MGGGLQKHMEGYVSACYDGIAVFLCIHIALRYRALMGKRNVPAMDRWGGGFGGASTAGGGLMGHGGALGGIQGGSRGCYLGSGACWEGLGGVGGFEWGPHGGLWWGGGGL